MNALHHACQESNFKIVDILIQKISDINSRTKKKQTALHLAILAGSFDITKFLIENGANFEIVDINKNTVLHMSAISDHYEITKYLLELFPHPEFKNLENKIAADLSVSEKIINALNNVALSNRINCNKMSANKDKNVSMTNLYSHNYGLKKPAVKSITSKISLKIGGSSSSNNINNLDFKEDKNKPKFINMNMTIGALNVDIGKEISGKENHKETTKETNKVKVQTGNINNNSHTKMKNEKKNVSRNSLSKILKDKEKEKSATKDNKEDNRIQNEFEIDHKYSNDSK